jgi:hypothetical protein
VRRRAILAALALGVAVAAVVAIVVLAAGRESAPSAPPPGGDAVELRTEITPSRMLAGDQATAVVELTVDTRRVDPAKIEVATVFRPFYRVGDIAIERDELGDRLVVRYRYPIQCVVRACAPGASPEPLTLPIGLVRYTPREGDVVSLPLEWAPVQILSRLTPDDFRAIQFAPADLAADQDLDAVPAPAFRGGPLLLGWLFVGLAAVIVLAVGGFVAWRTWPRGERGVAAEAVPALPPLQAALDGVEASLDENDERRRAALGELARRLVEAGDDELGREARRLAWSRSGPEPDRVRALLSRADAHRDGCAEAL